MLLTRRLAAGTQTVRAFQLRSDRSIWFSRVVTVTAVAGQTNEVTVDLEPGLKVSGHLDPLVPRPVKNGRVIVHVWPPGLQPGASPPQWHSWTTIHDDGSFKFTSLPPGELEIVVLCDGFISTNGPGSFSGMRYPQKRELGPKDFNITVGMEPTARLEVQVSDDKGNPLAGAVVATWPNVRYGDWGATIFASDCYNTLDWLTGEFNPESAGWTMSVPDFQGTSDGAGLAVVPNLPMDITEFSVEHPDFVLPAVTTSSGEKSRIANITVRAGRTNRASVRLEPRERSPISQY